MKSHVVESAKLVGKEISKILYVVAVAGLVGAGFAWGATFGFFGAIGVLAR